MTGSRPSEDELIARYFAPLAGEGALGLRDDAALLRPRPGSDLVLTVDAIVAGVHFFADDPPRSVARKALGVNVSDLVAKGASPAGFLLTLTLPEDWREAWLAAFCDGLGHAARAFGCPLLGGDTVRGPALAVSVTALGDVPSGRMVRRSAAKPGDRIVVSGTMGDGALGLALRGPSAPPWAAVLSEDERAFLLDRYLHPQPRLALASTLLEHASAAMDVSDGLAGDLAKMMLASGATAVVETAQVPLSAAARAALGADPALIDRLLTGGDDYEILAAVPPERLNAFLGAASQAGIATTPIGTVTEGQGLPVFHHSGTERRYERGSYSHF
ncbi:MAG TPA: thiamine-phosphate kinase [Beijerinckiaceae bacterium]|nr:thiamine-phosphate kinase [Beijerinckiaceae bacterium]